MTINGVYVLTVRESGHFYVGSSQDVDKRIDRHYNELKQGKHHCSPLQTRFDAGSTIIPSFYELTTRDEAYELEQLLILNNLNNDKLLNIGMAVRGGDNLTRNPKRLAIIERIKQSLKLRYDSLSKYERKLLWGRRGALNGMFGRAHTDEAKVKISSANKGNKYRLGHKASSETKAKLSAVASQRLGEKNPFYDKRHTDLVKKRISESKKGQLPTNLKPVSINGVVYASITEAGRQLGIPVPTVLFRIKSLNKKFVEYKFASEMPND